MHIQKLSRHEMLHYIKPHLSQNSAILEAGAFKGNDSLYMARIWPHATLHLFEPIPDIFIELKKQCQHLSNAYFWPIAPGAYEGTLSMHVAEKIEKPGLPTQASSAPKPSSRTEHSAIIYPKQIVVPVTTIDIWAHAHNISHIDFMWLDLQGYELHVLKNAIHIIATCKALLVELHFIQAYEEQPDAQEIITWLSAQGFVMVARDYEEPPQWFFGNGLFIKKNLIL